ncbi:hypothetical protein ElyMa_003902900 [Elysia marginata]|uniref:Uncharacterized protein n=1 Tax=Elysia marginata TaxID=1093978 RepID=A0AAV4FNL9_9GAST|nr:hypothetical protein ElyMa_003902900 [Elysia marginata]
MQGRYGRHTKGQTRRAPCTADKTGTLHRRHDRNPARQTRQTQQTRQTHCTADTADTSDTADTLHGRHGRHPARQTRQTTCKADTTDTLLWLILNDLYKCTSSLYDLSEVGTRLSSSAYLSDACHLAEGMSLFSASL